MDSPNPNKKMESALIPMELAARLRRASREKGIAKSDIIQLALDHELSSVILDPEDYVWMAEQVRHNKSRTSGRAAKRAEKSAK